MTSSPQNRTLWLVRHGDTIWSHTGGIAGRSDIELSEQGRARVVQLAATATTPVSQASWFVSPLKRTRETMNLLRSGSMHPNWVTSAPPGGETFQEHYERCSAWLDDWISTQDHHGSTSDYATSAVAANTAKTARPVSRSATAASGDAVVVTHGTVLPGIRSRVAGCSGPPIIVLSERAPQLIACLSSFCTKVGGFRCVAKSLRALLARLRDVRGQDCRRRR